MQRQSDAKTPIQTLFTLCKRYFGLLLLACKSLSDLYLHPQGCPGGAHTFTHSVARDTVLNRIRILSVFQVCMSPAYPSRQVRC